MEIDSVKYLTVDETAKKLGVRISTLSNWRSSDARLKQNLPFYRIAGRVYYREQEIQEWAHSQRQLPKGRKQRKDNL